MKEINLYLCELRRTLGFGERMADNELKRLKRSVRG